jgi:phosphoribosyl 1,2-cyclic phosphodiesterase
MKDTNWIKFLGTAGARFVVSKQLRESGGIWFSLDNTNILVDPGPGSLSKCARSKPRLDPGELDGIILTHRHIDHTTDANVMIEAMTSGGYNKRGALFATSDCLSPSEPVVFSYAREFVERVEILEAGKEYTLGNTSFSTPLRHIHPAETYGLKFQSSMGIVSCVSDSLYFPEMEEKYAGSSLLILNVVRFAKLGGEQIQHLSVPDAEILIERIKPEHAILTHFGMTMLREKPWEIASTMTEKLGIPVTAATDGMKFDLSNL